MDEFGDYEEREEERERERTDECGVSSSDDD